MKPVFQSDVSEYSFDKPRAMLEVIGENLLSALNEHYPEKKGYLIEHDIGAGTDPPFSIRWDISLSKGKLWRFKLVLEVFRAVDKAFFRVSLGRNLDHNGTCVMFGMILSFLGLMVASSQTGQAFTAALIAPVLIGSVIGGFILSFPIRPMVRSYVLAKAGKEGLEASEVRLIEEVKEVLRHAGQLL